MSKAVMLSIQPKWCELIASGKKTIEVRKTKPSIKPPFKCYIYMTQGKIKDIGDYSEWIYQNRMMVIGEFVCDNIDNLRFVPSRFSACPAGTFEEYVCKASCLSFDEIKAYMIDACIMEKHSKICVGNALYGWHITDLKIYDEPKELREFHKHDDSYDNMFGWLFEDIEKETPLTRPPQSWCYVEELV